MSAVLLIPAEFETWEFFALMFGFATFYAYPFLLKMALPFRAASDLSTAQLPLLNFFTVFHFGGWDSFALPWFVALPIAGMLFLGFCGA